jgi:PAS domain-containing protein
MGDDGIIVFDEDYRIEFANAVASEITDMRRTTHRDEFSSPLKREDIGYLDQMHSKVGIDESKRSVRRWKF